MASALKSPVRLLLCGAILMVCALGTAEDLRAQAEPRYDVLVFSKTTGFRHTAAISAGHAALEQMGTENGFNTTHSEDAGEFTSHNLRNYDVVVFLNTDGEGILNASQRTAFERWMQSGGGAVGIHADANADKAWTWKRDMMGGGMFANHPPIQTGTMSVADPDHPATEDLPATFQWSDEWYNFEADPRANVHVLLTVDESTYTGGQHGPGHPIAWCSNYDGGRHFYTAVGHADGGATPAWSDARYLSHVSGGLEWAAGEEGAASDCGPERTAPPTAASLRKVTLDDDTANPMGLSVANDGRVFYAQMGSTQSTSGPAQVKVYDPEADETSVVGTLQVFRRNEIGLMGIALDPNFDTNNFMYLYYGRPGGQNTDMGANRLSRFTFNPSAGPAGQLEMSSEVVLLEVPNQRLVCCHESGSVQFGPDGLLYLSTGDNTEHARSNGYAPMDSRECGPGSWNAGDADCNADPASWPSDARHANDSRRSSGNTNDLRGKIVRIDPMDAATPGTTPGPGSTYTVPEGNLFAPGTPLTRPEIYTMGHRNAFRFGFDSLTGWIYQGEVGPDANQDNLQAPGHPVSGNTGRGPRGYDEINQIRSAGNFGWPFCIANSKAYRPWTYTGTGNSGAGVPNPDANVPYYDCANGPTNDSPVNTGQSVLPPARDAWIYYPYGASAEFPDIPPAGSRAAIGGPVYRYDPDLNSDVKLSSWFDGRLIWADWTRNVMLTTKVGPNGEYQGTTELLPQENFLHTHDIELGPDGAIYMLEWGNNFNYGSYGVNADSGLYRLEQVQPGDHPPVATASADVLTGQAPLEVQFTGELSDQGGVEPPSYEWDFGDGGTSTEVNPTHTFTEPGTYEVTLTVSDGEVTDSQTLAITALAEGECLPQLSDEFDGTDLDPGKWQVVRRDADLTVSGGAVHILAANQDIVGGGGNMPNIVVGDMPSTSAPWTYTVRMTWNPTTNFQNAGLIIYADDDNYLKSGMVWSGSRQFEAAKETGGSFGVIGSSGNVGTAFPQTFYVRFVSTTGQNVQAQYAPDVGGQPGTFVNTTGPSDLSGLTNPKIGIYATSSTQSGAARIPADFHSVTVEPDGGPCDEEPPVTTAQLNGAAPQPTYDGPVEVTLSATDGEGEEATGVDYTEYRVDGGDWVRQENTGEADPFVAEFSVSSPGEHVVEYRSADGNDNVEEIKSVSFEIEGQGGCLPQRSDEFDGTALNGDLWSVVREDTSRLSVSGGAVNLVSAPLDIHGGASGMPNIVLQDMPATNAPWSFTVRYTWNPTQNFQNAGLLIYVDDANWIKSGMVWSGGRRFEAFKELNNTPTGLGPATAVLPASFPETFYVRYNSTTGQDVQAQYSPDGQTWTNTGTATDLSGLANAKIGFYATASTQSGVSQPTASFDSVTVVPDAEPCEEDDLAPVTTAELDGAAPRPSYTGPVQVALSATDPAGGGSAPQNHTVTGDGFAWDPAELEIAAGDTVTWDIEEGFHDVCLDTTPPTTGPPPTGRCGADEEIASDFVGTQSGSKTFDAPGTFDFYCSVHWPTMKGTVTVTGGGGTEPSGVDYTEYRIDSDDPADWVRRENTGDEDPFETAFTVAEAGDHTVEYRSVDKAGNEEASKSVSFQIQETAPGTPIVRGFADPSSGAAPLHARFSSTAIDPDGGPLSYKWVVEGVGTVLGSQFEHTFREAGVYTATVTVTDDEGDTASDTVEVTVGGTGNQAPTVEATADPGSGQAPLTVQFHAAGDDPDGPSSGLTYAWTFGDGGVSFEQDPSHTYLAPGTHTATVTVRDAGGASGTDTAQITVANPQGNRPPTVEVGALPGSGPAPLDVLLTAEGTDPDGDSLTYSWSFGDGGPTATGGSVRHTYQTSGTYTATVTASDGRGGTDTAEVQVVVGNPAGNQAPTVEAVADPASGTAPLNVRFSSAARDPDGDPLLYVWSFGDGGSGGGAAVTHTYTAPGTYTATITVTDSHGASGTDAVEVVVTGTQALGGQQGGGDPSAAPETDAWFGVNRPARTSAARFAKRGLKVTVTCTDAMSGSAVLKVDRRTSRRLGLKSTTLASRPVRCADAGTTTVTLKPTRSVARRLTGVKRLKATLRVTLERAGTVKRQLTFGARR